LVSFFQSHFHNTQYYVHVYKYSTFCDLLLGLLLVGIFMYSYLLPYIHIKYSIAIV
jgi:hypothetical protein